MSKAIFVKGKSGVLTRYGEGFQNGFVWGIFFSAVVFVLVVAA